MKDRVTDQNKKQKIIMISIFTASLVLIVALVILLAFLPFFKAGAKMRGVCEVLDDPDSVNTVLLTDMSSVNEAFGMDGGEASVTSAEDISELCKELYAVASECEFKGKTNAPLSAWDIRVRLYLDEERMELYLAEDKIYILDGATRYNFTGNSLEYTELYERVLSMLEETDK